MLALSDRFRVEGYEVVTESDGSAGLAVALNDSFDLILLNVMLPGKSGYDICREVRGRGIKTPIVMLTARSQVVDKVVGLKLGVDDYITKPFDTSELLARMEAQLRRAPGAEKSTASSSVEYGSIFVKQK